MNQNQKQTEKAQKILSRREIEKRRVFDIQKRAEKGSFLELGSRKWSEWKLQRMRRMVLKVETGFSRLSLDE